MKKLHRITFILLILLAFQFNSKAQVVEKIEPPCWWVGMKNHDLQIMVYGKDIANYEITVKEKQLFKSIEKTENPNYAFINLTIPEKTKTCEIPIEFSKDGKVVETLKYKLNERSKNTKQHQGFDNSDVIYLLMPDRFANGDTTNDSSDQMLEKADRTNPDGRHGGDIQGIIDHLGYFNELGLTALWINPLLENNQKSYTYHGYAITNFYQVDPRYGNNNLYRELVSDAHDKNLKIIMDMVLNHCGINHWWMNDLPAKDWIHQFPEYTQCNFRSSAMIDPYASEYDKNLQQTGWFDRNMPDLNQQNPFLAKYLIQNAIWWIEFSGIDGIRLDTQPYADKNMVADWAKAILTEYPDFNIIGESWLQKIALTSYWQASNSNYDHYSSNIPVVTDFPLHYAITQAFNEKQEWSSGMAKLYYVLAQDFLYANPSNTLVFLDNHDVDRIYSSLGQDISKLKMAIAFQLTTRGIPSVYYGTELLKTGYSSEQHGKMRSDFPGGWPNDSVNCFIPDGRSEKQNEIYHFYSKILNWRKNAEVIHSGKLTHFVPEDNIYVYFRHSKTNCVMVVLNNNDTPKTIDTKRFAEILAKYNTGTDIISDRQIQDLSKIELDKKSAMIIELK